MTRFRVADQLSRQGIFLQGICRAFIFLVFLLDVLFSISMLRPDRLAKSPFLAIDHVQKLSVSGTPYLGSQLTRFLTSLSRLSSMSNLSVPRVCYVLQLLNEADLKKHLA